MSSEKPNSSSEKSANDPKLAPEVETVKDAGSEAYSDESKKCLIVSDEERRLVRKLDWRILPITCMMYLFAYLDRSNLGNARLQGLPQDTLHGDPTGKLFDWVNSAFFFSYILCQIPASVVSKLFPPRLWLGSAALGWGLCSTLMATAFNFAGLIVARVGLGVFEAGFGPGVPLYLSYFYTKHEMGLRMAYWFGFAAVAGAFGGLIAFGIQHAHAAVANWRLLFIVEGIPALLMGLVALVFLPDRPEKTHFLNEDERKIAIARMNRAISGDTGFVVNKNHIFAALKDWRIYVGGVIYFGLNNALASISAFLPTIIKTFGYTNAIAQLLTVPPYAVAAVVLTITSYTSDRLQHRGMLMSGASAVGGIGYLILLLVHNNVHAQYFAVFCITSGTYTTIGLIIAWFAHNLGSETKRATGIPMFMAIGQCGSVLGSHIYPSTEGPRYIKGFAVSCALEFLAAICALILSASYFWDNRRRDRIYGKPEPEAKVDTSELADKAPLFRYLT
ncbi:MFS general substrate transporter [Fomitiporia mediterranea MF3/22]|uniref:MFS general substrate transporter n=1 Tax=Fomitiporia mediterranea (strain MF3/22) TaxID=694068 RepID=UPI00044074B3|nr:MFS general substrate transporter [Fomitiporia mediterranea MF3/22]EJD05399.1 MFS general substrate transporter [Fomitiporia mediterranea MF3/22]